MNVTLKHPAGSTEFDIPEENLKLVRTFLMELTTRAQNEPTIDLSRYNRLPRFVIGPIASAMDEMGSLTAIELRDGEVARVMRKLTRGIIGGQTQVGG